MADSDIVANAVVFNSPEVFPVAVDGYFENKLDSEWPTFIKMNIEGAEHEALLGAAEIVVV